MKVTDRILANPFGRCASICARQDLSDERRGGSQKIGSKRRGRIARSLLGDALCGALTRASLLRRRARSIPLGEQSIEQRGGLLEAMRPRSPQVCWLLRMTQRILERQNAESDVQVKAVEARRAKLGN